ncbi:pro-neuregulin-4, membrane-bound isoform isoform X1 [Agelaius tricolor]|uniref:pro-neuregulin-4, membrane-bound isoform isoform X1 n=1 Tax=Agelaius tricolor TaxID=9191 RepID=UPI0039F1DA2D
MALTLIAATGTVTTALQRCHPSPEFTSQWYKCYHEELCGTSYGSFCLNGGICYMIPTVSSPFCRCIENYTGARCEEVLLPSIKSQTKGDLFAAFLASLLLLGVLVIGAFYFLCRKVSIPRTSSSECGANLVETTSSNGCNKITTA